jgi:hypothetical protein
MCSRYDVYVTFKEVENEVKNKKTKIASEDTYSNRMSDDTLDAIRQIADLFNTRYSNVDLKEFIRCGFHHFKGFNYDKMFRDIVLKEYIARDSRTKRNTDESLSKILLDLKYINRSLDIYTKESDGHQPLIIRDYLLNRIGSTVITYCIWRNIFIPTDSDWEYLSTIKNNYPLFEKNVVKFAGLIDKWQTKMRDNR